MAENIDAKNSHGSFISIEEAKDRDRVKEIFEEIITRIDPPDGSDGYPTDF